jgi:hypothetical protein
VKEKLDKLGFRYNIKGRTKSIHSIMLKMKKQGVEFDEVYDLFAVRIIVDSEQENEKADCWRVYSVVTDLYQPIRAVCATGYPSRNQMVMNRFTQRWWGPGENGLKCRSGLRGWMR